jgi:hypothetical protein
MTPLATAPSDGTHVLSSEEAALAFEKERQHT